MLTSLLTLPLYAHMHIHMAPPSPSLPPNQRGKKGTKHWNNTAQAHQTRVHAGGGIKKKYVCVKVGDRTNGSLLLVCLSTNLQRSSLQKTGTNMSFQIPAQKGMGEGAQIPLKETTRDGLYWSFHFSFPTEQGCGIKGFVPTSVMQGNLPLYIGWSLGGPFCITEVDSISHNPATENQQVSKAGRDVRRPRRREPPLGQAGHHAPHRHREGRHRLRGRHRGRGHYC